MARSHAKVVIRAAHLVEEKTELIDSRTVSVALVHDWLTGMRGGEKVLEVFCELFPQAPIYTLLHNEGAMSELIERRDIRVSFIDRLPRKSTHYRNYLPVFPVAIERFDFSEFDLILSTSHCVAKGARPKSGALHICYCHTPMRYVWEMYDEYFGKGRAGLVTRVAMRFFAPRLRRWDVQSSNRVHHFIANSNNVARRIHQYYGRTAEVIHAPVDLSFFSLSTHNEGYYLIVSALVPYKRVDLAVEVFNRRGEKLLIVGTGPEFEKLRNMAKPNVEFLGWQSGEELARLYAGCRALIFPGIEDFGIVPLEAMACGKPVIAYGAGGALETVMPDGEHPNGVFFYEQDASSLTQAIDRCEKMQFDPTMIRASVERFDRPRFKERLRTFIESKWREHLSPLNAC